VSTGRSLDQQWRWGAVFRYLAGQAALDRARILDAVGLDQEAAVEIEELEVARMKRSQPRERIARESELQDVFVATARDIDERARATGYVRRRIARLDAAHHSP